MRNKLRNEALLSSFLWLGACDKPLTKAEFAFLLQLLPSIREGVLRPELRRLGAIQPNQAQRPLRTWITAASPSVSDRRKVLRALHDFALCDGPLSAEEELALREISEALGLNLRGKVVSPRKRTGPIRAQRDQADAANRSKRPLRPEEQTAVPRCYAILGCSPSDTDEAIKRSYRQLALKLHPDKHPTQPELAASHVRAFQQLNEAYDEIKKLRAQK